MKATFQIEREKASERLQLAIDELKKEIAADQSEIDRLTEQEKGGLYNPRREAELAGFTRSVSTRTNILRDAEFRLGLLKTLTGMVTVEMEL